MDTFENMKSKDKPEITEDDNVIRFNSNYFEKFLSTDTESEKLARSKHILRQTINKFSSELSGKKILVSKNDVDLPHTFSKPNIRILKPSLLKNNELDLSNDLETDEGFYVDLEKDGDEVILKISETSNVKVKKTQSSYNITETNDGNSTSTEIDDQTVKNSGYSGKLKTLSYTLGSVSGEFVKEPEPIQKDSKSSNPIIINVKNLEIKIKNFFEKYKEYNDSGSIEGKVSWEFLEREGSKISSENLKADLHLVIIKILILKDFVLLINMIGSLYYIKFNFKKSEIALGKKIF